MALLVSCEEEPFDGLIGDGTEEVAVETDTSDDAVQTGEEGETEEGNGEESTDEDSESDQSEEEGEGEEDENEGSEDEDSEENDDSAENDEDYGDEEEEESEEDADETGSDETNDDGKEAAADIAEIKALIAEGAWKIRRYRQNNSFEDPRDVTDTTSDFDGYTFDFDLNGTVSVTINGSVVGQEWSLTEDGNGLVFSLHISGNDAALNTLDKAWRAASFSEQDFVVLVGERDRNTRMDNRIFLAFEKL